jgi:phage major head subunit gpT-like protein
MIINSANLEALRVAFNASFKRGLEQAESQYGRIATTVPSSTKENRYGWLGKMPNMREWIGARVVHGIAEHDYSIKNKPFELTIGVDRDDIEDDNIGVYDPMFVEMGESVAAHPDQLVWELLAAGFATECYDGQYFFDTDHPVLDKDGNPATVSNFQGGSGTPWYLLNTKRSLKPLIFQERKTPMFVAKDKVTDDNVFSRKEYVYGTESRCNVGFGFWQMAYASRQTLNAANFASARQAMMSLKGDYGRPLGIKPDLLIVPPSLEDEAEEILKADRNAAGATNTQKGKTELLVVPWLA